MSDFTPLDEAIESNAGKFLCWPVFDEEEAADRLTQLAQMGVESVALGGPHLVYGDSILGKGHVGVVIRAIYDGREVALKCRRTDAVRHDMGNEARLLMKANEAGVGPLVYAHSVDFIVMEKLTGAYFGDWVRENIEKRDKIRAHVAAIIDIARRLDVAGIDHGELTKIRRHYIVTRDGPRVIDFESSSLGRMPHNLTSTVQSMFMYNRFSTLLSGSYDMPDRGRLLAALKIYKRAPKDENYQSLREALNLD